MARRCESDSMPLALFIRKYSLSLPLRIRVEEGFYGNDERSVISSGDIYNLHFIRKTETMSIRDTCGTHYSIPFNSSISFGLVYNPFSEPYHAVRQYVFTTVEEIMTCRNPPPIFRATREFITTDTKSSIAREEILILKKICRSGKKKRHHIKVHSLLTGNEKILYRECSGRFQTDPGSVRLYIPEIAAYFKESLPVVARVFLNSDVTDDNISSLVSDVVTLTHVSIESSIIATACWNDETKPNSQEEITDANNQKIPIAIPVDLSIEVSLLTSRSGHNEELYQFTRHLFEGFQWAKIKDMKEENMSVDDPKQTLQRTLNRSVRIGHEKQGVVIEKPTKVYKKNSKTRNKEESQVKPLEVKPPTVQVMSERMHSARRLPSISYSTFTSAPRAQNHLSVSQSSRHRSLSPPPPALGSNTNSSLYDVPRRQLPPPTQSVTDTQPSSVTQAHLEMLKPTPCPVVPSSCIDDTKSADQLARLRKDSVDKDSIEGTSRCALFEANYDIPKSAIAIRDKSPSPTSLTNCAMEQKQNSSLSELIRNHALLSAQNHSQQRKDSDSVCGPSACKGQGLVSVHTSSSGNCEALEHNAPCHPKGTTLKKDTISTLQTRPESLANRSHTPSLRTISTSIVHDSQLLVQKPRKSSSAHEQSHSDILSASMNRAQTLKARNIQNLKRLDCHEVQVLLENMNLGQYKEHFFSEGIDGEILSECDDHVLLYELNVSSELHRAQLMNVIFGKQSVSLILSGQCTQDYVKFSVH